MKIDIDKNIALKSFDSLTMTSKEVAELCDKQHKHVIRDIENMMSEIDGPDLDHDLNSSITVKKDKRGYTSLITLDKELTLTLVSGYNVKLRNRIVKRFIQLEQEAAEEKIRAEARQKARLDAPRLTDALKSHLEELGKDPKWYHYANEHNMIYRAIFKKTCKQLLDKLNLAPDESLRDHLTAGQICLVEELQVADKVLIEAGVEYNERKEMLEKVVQRRALGYVRIGESTIGEP